MRKILFFALPVYLIANLYLLAIGEVTITLLRAANIAYVGLLAWLTTRLTSPLPPEKEPAPARRAALWAQTGVLALIIVLSALPSGGIPLWSGMMAWLHRAGEAFLPGGWFGGPGNAVANPVQYFVIPFILLLLLGAKPADMGFGRGHRVWRVCLLWAALPLLLGIGLIVAGMLPAQAFARSIIGNTFQNGFFEEFLFRGALQTRFYHLKSSPWMLLLQAVVFGLWHLRANTQSMNGDILAGLAICLTMQAAIGLFFGYIFQRTRNLIAPSVAHVASNVLGQMFG